MKRKIMLMMLALALTLLSGCGGAGHEGGVSGKGIFYTRAATDEEAFSQVLELWDEEELDLEDEAVPLSGGPGEAAEETWVLVRCAKNQDGTGDPLWYRVWSEAEGWSEENLPYEGKGWSPVLTGPAAEEVRPLG